MHTFVSAGAFRFHHNADFSGDVIIETPAGEFRLPGDALLEFVARTYVLPARISLLEDLGADSDARVAQLRAATAPELLLGTA